MDFLLALANPRVRSPPLRVLISLYCIYVGFLEFRDVSNRQADIMNGIVLFRAIESRVGKPSRGQRNHWYGIIARNDTN